MTGTSLILRSLVGSMQSAHNEMLQKITATLASSLHVSRIVTSRLPGANLAAMPLHWSVAQAIRERDEQAAEEAMRKLFVLHTSPFGLVPKR
jgi:DNA-binding FadR family transcriptional regulator